MNEPRHLFLEAVFYAEKIDPDQEYDYCCERGDKHDDPESFKPPVDVTPMLWLYGSEFCELIGLPPGEWHQPEYDECMERWVYTVQENAYNIPEEAWQRFADLYNYLPEYSEANMGMLGAWPEGGIGMRPGWRWNDDGGAWNMGGWTPVLYVTLSVTCTEEEFLADPNHFGFELVEEGA